MTESEFQDLAEATLDAIETALEDVSESGGPDLEKSRNGNILEIEFMHDGSKIIVNSQAPMKEIWVAAKAGGYHFKYVDGKWRDTRAGTELFASLSTLVSGQSGQPFSISLKND